MEKPAGKMIIYQMLPRLFGNKKTVNKPYGTLEENGAGKFNDVTDNALKALKEMGITHVWYTGVLEHATLTDYAAYNMPADDADVVKGRAGSPYAIRDYYDVDPDLATHVPDRMQEFEALVTRTHLQGLGVLIDFVPNHVARAYHSDARPAGVKDLGEGDDATQAFAPANNFYYLPGQSFQPPAMRIPPGLAADFPAKDGRFEETPAKATGNDVFSATPGADDWFETVKLNYGVDIAGGGGTYFDPVPDTWLKMRDILLYWAGKQIDGFRCDMAEMVPVDFWKWVIPQVKEVNADILFIAEIYNPDRYRTYLETGGFDYLYDKSLLYDTLRLVIGGKTSTTAVHAVQQRLAGINDRMLHFMENHDEQRLASGFFAGDSWKGAPAMLISATIDRGPVMIYNGQEVGERAEGAEGFSGDDGRTTIFDYWSLPRHQQWMNGGKFDGGQLELAHRQIRMFYSELLNLAGKSTAIAHGNYFDLTEHNIRAGFMSDNVHVFARASDDERLLIVNGFNSEEETARIQIPGEVIDKMGMDRAVTYFARDLLWHEIEVGFDENWSFELRLKPYSCLVFKIK